MIEQNKIFRMTAFAIVTFAGLFMLQHVHAKPLKFQPGQYEQLLLAVDSDGSLTGYYHDEIGQGVWKKECGIFIAGKSADGVSASIETFTGGDEVFPGRLVVVSDEIKVDIPKARNHDGCGMMFPDDIPGGMDLTRVLSTPWLEIRTVSDKKVHFHSAPDEEHALKAYVVQGDVVAVVARQGDWLQVDHIGEKKTTRTWVRKDATAALTAQKPPAAH
jgi:Bacterial SH3 domain